MVENQPDWLHASCSGCGWHQGPAGPNWTAALTMSCSKFPRGLVPIWQGKPVKHDGKNQEHIMINHHFSEPMVHKLSRCGEQDAKSRKQKLEPPNFVPANCPFG